MLNQNDFYLANRNYRIRKYPIKFYNPKSWSLLFNHHYTYFFDERKHLMNFYRQRLYLKVRCSDYFCFHSSPTPRHAISNKSDCNCQFSFHSGFLVFEIRYLFIAGLEHRSCHVSYNFITSKLVQVIPNLALNFACFIFATSDFLI